MVSVSCCAEKYVSGKGQWDWHPFICPGTKPDIHRTNHFVALSYANQRDKVTSSAEQVSGRRPVEVCQTCTILRLLADLILAPDARRTIRKISKATESLKDRKQLNGEVLVLTLTTLGLHRQRRHSPMNSFAPRIYAAMLAFG